MLFWFGIIFVVLFVLGVTSFFILGKYSQIKNVNLGVDGGRLKACSASPNCVVSYAQDTQHKVEPIAGGAEAFERLRAHVKKQANAAIKAETQTYIYAVYRSKLFGFVDDVELLLTEEGIHVRSASRVGHSDFNANRKRVEFLRCVSSCQ